MSTINTSTIKTTSIQHTNGTTAAIIDSSGYFYRSNIVTWHARLNTAQSTGTLVWQVEDWDTSNSFNTTTGRFTVPVAGYYFIKFHLLPANASTADTRFEIRKNNVTIEGERYIITKTANTWNTIQGSCITQANVNDYFTIVFISGDTLHNDSNYVSFQGFLI